MFTLRIEGGRELAAALNALPAKVSRAVKIDALMTGGERIRRMASQHAPREPGSPDLANNINIRPVRRDVDADPEEVRVGIGVPKGFFYDYFQEYGTVRMGAQPFYRPAFDAEVPAVLGIVGKALWTALAARGVGQSVTAPTAVSSGGRFL